MGWFNTGLNRFSISMGCLLLLQGCIAALLSRVFRQPFWWQPIHLLFPPAVWLMLSFQLPAWLYLLIFLLLLLLFWGTIKGDVPLFLSSSAVIDALSEIIEKQQIVNLIELGAGIGSVVVPLAKRLPDLPMTALENAPLPWLILRWRCRKLSNVKVLRVNLWDFDLADYQLAFAFLSPLVMIRLADKARRQMRPCSWLVSSSFPAPEWRPDRIVKLADRRKTQLFCYRIRGGC